MRSAPSVRKIALLGALYFAQGLPYGFQVTALPVYLREQGVSLTAIGWVGALSLPWLLKVLWAPLVDRWYLPRWGRRKSWILPAQIALATACACAALVPVASQLTLLLALVFLMNLAAATQDIAVDGLAADLLERHELGPGNAAQVVGYKIGMLTGGGLLLWASDTIGWQGLFAVMAGLVCLVVILVGWMREPPPPEVEAVAGRSVAQIAQQALGALRLRTGLWVLFAIATYKTGEAMSDAMFKPFLVDAGISASTIGLWVGTWGKGFSIAGSLLGGWLAYRWRIHRALMWVSWLRVLPLIGVWILSWSEVTEALVVTITCAEHLFGGALTTVMFALMMRTVDRRVGATHFTALAALEVLGKSPGAWLSGAMADGWGYGTVFASGAILSLLYAVMVSALGAARLEPVDNLGPDGRPGVGSAP